MVSRRKLQMHEVPFIERRDEKNSAPFAKFAKDAAPSKALVRAHDVERPQ